MKCVVLEQNSTAYQLMTDGRTVWVNDSFALCIGRLSPIGMDVHAKSEQQRKGEHCLDCRSVRGLSAQDRWKAFVESMRVHHNVVLPEDFFP